MARVFITRAIPGDAAKTLESAGHEVTVWPGDLPPSPAELLAALEGVSGVMTMVTDRIDGPMLAAVPTLQIAANMAVGYDNLDTSAGDAAGTWMTNTPGILHRTTAEFAMALILAGTRSIATSDRDTRDGGWKTWSPTAFLGIDLFSATVGIIGPGEIGAEVARLCRAFGARVLYTSRSPKPKLEREFGLVRADLDDLLRESDVVSLHVPRTADTAKMLGPREFALMKPGSLLVNTARGGVIDQDALVDALRAGRPGFAALDVTDPEPLPLSHPLYSLPNVTITPHIASASVETRSRMAECAAQNIIAALRGETPPNPVNRPPAPR